MARFTRWLRRNADAVLALLISVVVGILALADVLGTDQVDAAILLVLALLAVTLLGDRKSASQALTTVSAVRLLSGLEVSQVHAEARRTTEQWIFKGGTGTYLRAVTLKECVENARRENRLLRVQVEIIDPTAQALIFEKGRPYYDAYSRELVASFKQAKQVPLDRTGELQLSTEPTVEETRKLFSLLELELPGSFSERDITDLIRKALRAQNPYP